MDVHDVSQQYQPNIAMQRDRLIAANMRRGQRPSDRKSKHELKSKFMLILMMHNMNANAHTAPQNVMVHSSFVPPAYPPCTVSLATLTPIMIRELQLETHHRGRYVVLQSVTPPSCMTAVMAIMVDEEDEAVMVQLYQQEDEDVRPASTIVDVGTVLVVKEPFFKVMGDGEYGIRVDHLSDVVALDVGSDIMPKPWRAQFAAQQPSAETLKAKGNDHMKSGNYWDAIKVLVKKLTVSNISLIPWAGTPKRCISLLRRIWSKSSSAIVHSHISRRTTTTPH